jgi:hypothetical protein
MTYDSRDPWMNADDDVTEDDLDALQAETAVLKAHSKLPRRRPRLQSRSRSRTTRP